MAERVGFGPSEIAPVNNLRQLRNAQSDRHAQKPPSWNDPGTVHFADTSRHGSELMAARSLLAAEQAQKRARVHDSHALVLFERQ